MLKPLEMTAELAKQLVAHAHTLDLSQIKALQQERFLILVDYARRNSPYLKEKYKDMPFSPKLTDVPVITRDEAMKNFDDWVCDSDITTAGLDKYLSSMENATDPYLEKYTVLTTSGTTGRPLRMVRDSRHNIVNSALMSARLFGGSKLKAAGLSPIMRAAGVLPGSGYHSTYLAYLRTKKVYEQIGHPDWFLPLFLDMSTTEMVDALNEFQPEMLTGYPSNLRLLALQQQKGKLKISPRALGCSAEQLSLDTLKLVEEAFGCPIVDNYCSTEGGELAMLCECNHMHINSDWMILEPVDENMQLVPNGVQSSGTLLTNLANLVQPIIRYYISDKIVISEEPCPCGCPLPIMKIDGRNEDTLVFTSETGEEMPIASSNFIGLSLHIEGCDQLQFIQREPKLLEIRYITDSSASRQTVGEEIHKATRTMLDKEMLETTKIILEDQPPILGKTGKMRNTMCLL